MVSTDSTLQDPTKSHHIQAAADFVATGDFPVEWVCPITQTLMQEPALTLQGNVYERAATTEWLQLHDTDPLTNNHLTEFTLIPCKARLKPSEQLSASLVQQQQLACQLPSHHLQSCHHITCEQPNRAP